MDTQQEITKFNDLADKWWDTSGPMAPLHGLNSLRVPFIHETLNPPSANRPHMDVLDVGCGAGILSESIACLGYQVVATDPATRNIEIAKNHAQQMGLDIDYHEGLIENLDLKTFDAILVMEVVEHVPDVQELLSECIKRLKPGGHLFVATINRTLASFVTAIVGAEYIFRMLPKGTHEWSKFVKPEEIINPLNRSNMTLAKTSGISVNPFGPRFRLTGYIGVNYMLAFKKHIKN